MKNRLVKSITTWSALVVMALVFTQCSNGFGGFNDHQQNSPAESPDVCECIQTNYPTQALSQDEIDGLLLMREEEKLARDVYLGLYAQWNTNVFSNIAKAEQKHMDVIGCLLDKYELVDPIQGNESGVFNNDNLQELYNTLMEQGEQSVVGALMVGATIEDVDIFDLMNLSENVVDNEDILAAYKELTKGSRNHLRAFIKKLNQEEVSYSPQFITVALFNDIINGDHEQGSEMCPSGGGNGNNSGNSENNGNGGHHGNGHGDGG